MPKSKKVDAYIKKSPDFAQPILKKMRKLVHEAVPEAEEVLKWGFPNFDYAGGILCGMASFKKHCAFSFWKGTMMKDPSNILEIVGKTALGSLGKITSLDDLPSDKIMIKYLQQAAKLNEQGVKMPTKPRDKPYKLDIPDYFLKALKKNNKALTTFVKLPPSHKKEYVEWVTEAKREETRDRRLTKSIEMLLEGKDRNWKYR